jgi:hypothetical protein
VNALSPDLLIYLLIIAGILFFNHLAQRAARRRQEEAAAAAPPAEDEPLEEIFGRAPPVQAAGPAPAMALAPARMQETRPLGAEEVRRRRSAARALLQGPRDLRRAIVVMTVLGPCRALEPPGGAGGANGGRELSAVPRA